LRVGGERGGQEWAGGGVRWDWAASVASAAPKVGCPGWRAQDGPPRTGQAKALTESEGGESGGGARHNCGLAGRPMRDTLTSH
jgi:hypothetical protein